MVTQFKQIWRGKSARTLELLREEQEPKTPLEILIEEEENELDISRKKQKYIKKEVRKALSRLSLRQRQCVKLYFIKNRKQKEIGEILGISHQAVSECLKFARNNLKKSLKGYLQNAEKTLYYEG